MRTADGDTETMSTMATLEGVVLANPPLRPVRLWLNDTLKCIDGVWARMYEGDAKGGRPRIAPEKLIRAVLLQGLYSIRSERVLMAQHSCNRRCRLSSIAMDDAVWVPSTVSKNRDRLLAHDVIGALFHEMGQTAHARGQRAGEHCSVDGSWIQV